MNSSEGKAIELTTEAKSQLNPKAPEFVPLTLLPPPPPPPPHHHQTVPFELPPPHPHPPFVIWYYHFRTPPTIHFSKPPPSFFPTNPKPPHMLEIEASSNSQQPSHHGRRRRTPIRRRTGTGTGTGSGVWVPKPPVSSYPFGNSTSLMVRNIPVRLSRRELIELLDDHCRKENEKLLLSSSSPKEPPSEFDFLYLPVDFKRKGNLGYAFVNFTTWEGASRLFNSWRGFKWESCSFNTHKICQFNLAKFQGKEALKKHFQMSTFYCDTDEYLPVEISPPMNGSNSDLSKLITIGTRAPRGRR